jgi:hypothetical protein
LTVNESKCELITVDDRAITMIRQTAPKNALEGLSGRRLESIQQETLGTVASMLLTFASKHEAEKETIS